MKMEMMQPIERKTIVDLAAFWHSHLKFVNNHCITLFQTFNIPAGKCNTNSMDGSLILWSFGVFKVGLQIKVK